MEQYQGDSVILPYSHNFVPTDILDPNVLLSLKIRSPIKPEDSLANLLYADLKLKRLIEERKALQKRSQQLLANLGLHYIQLNPDLSGKGSFSPYLL